MAFSRDITWHSIADFIGKKGIIEGKRGKGGKKGRKKDKKDRKKCWQKGNGMILYTSCHTDSRRWSGASLRKFAACSKFQDTLGSERKEQGTKRTGFAAGPEKSFKKVLTNERQRDIITKSLDGKNKQPVKKGNKFAKQACKGPPGADAQDLENWTTLKA